MVNIEEIRSSAIEKLKERGCEASFLRCFLPKNRDALVELLQLKYGDQAHVATIEYEFDPNADKLKSVTLKDIPMTTNTPLDKATEEKVKKDIDYAFRNQTN